MDQPVSARQGASGRRVAFAIFGLLSVGFLGGCVETTALSGADSPEARAKVAANVLDAGGVRVALASLTGVPQPFENRLKDAFAAQATERNITLADPAKATFLVRGYVTAYPAAEGTTIAAVYDVFDAKKNRARRLEDDVVVKTDGADPWSGIDPAAIDNLATKSADDLAAFLITTPEALAAAEPASGSDPAARGASGRGVEARGDEATSGPGAGRTPAQAAKVASGVSVAALR